MTLPHVLRRLREGADIEPPVGIALLPTGGALGSATAAAGVRLAQADDRRAALPGGADDAALPHEEPRRDALGAPAPAGSPTFTHPFTRRNA